MDLSLAGAFLLTLYLAVIFQTFAGGPASGKGTPFYSELRYRSANRSRRTTVLMYVGVQLVAIGGGSFALVDCGEPVVAGALAFMAVLVGMRQSLWMLRHWNNQWYYAHPHGVLNVAFFAPVIAGLLTAALVALI
jgi:hypothetical protein